MRIVLGSNQYGKAGSRNVRYYHDTDRPHGLIETSVARDGGSEPAWLNTPGLC
ncbi:MULTISPECIES: hypothetical protein [unclassified Mycolicibacterium]|uniref:hypothetical protein n=1 Tax=unclassified Mycolicibacterium TaxID=2636767 RepID=UPI002EDB3215